MCKFPRNVGLEVMIDNHWQQQQQQLQEAVVHSEISPEDLQLTDDVIGWGAAGIVRRGVINCRGDHMKVSFPEVTSKDIFSLIPFTHVHSLTT